MSTVYCCVVRGLNWKLLFFSGEYGECHHSVLTMLMACALFCLTSLRRQSLLPPVLSCLAVTTVWKNIPLAAMRTEEVWLEGMK